MTAKQDPAIIITRNFQGYHVTSTYMAPGTAYSTHKTYASARQDAEDLAADFELPIREQIA